MLEIAARHPIADIRERAASALGRIRSPQGVPALVPLVNDSALVRSGERVSRTARKALKQIGTPEALAALDKQNGNL